MIQKQKFSGFTSFFVDFQNFTKFKLFWRLLFVILSTSINFPWSHVGSHIKLGPDRYSRFNVYWIQPVRQTDKLMHTAYCIYYTRLLGGSASIFYFSLKHFLLVYTVKQNQKSWRNLYKNSWIFKFNENPILLEANSCNFDRS